MTDAEAFLYLLKAEPTLLPAAPVNWTARDIDVRRLGGDGQRHTCLKCGGEARVALVADTKIGPRWLDLCPDHHLWLQSEGGDA